eukprot:TRINITY_DN286_c5_g1_i1.p1 TRINITY_DN286_c5_g1~~TRINITY_DN286_c5_g1_i1.p1  ORF type:complete len:630 (-),score=266.25 TRINITY_DN286_c5_g1_i1:209-2098(-)
MPTVGVVRDDLFKALGKEYTEEEFDELCFEFGIELDEVTTEPAEAPGQEPTIIYKLDIPANRYDLLCLEGLARALNIFLGRASPPDFRLVEPASGRRQTITVKPSTAQIRPYVVCAVLRGVTFDARTYKSFIDLQDKLHQNICRRRTLVAIGTHDLDTLEGPFTYEALPPEDIEFVPLVPCDRGAFKAKALLDLYNTDVAVKHLKPYTGIIYDSPVYPVVLDARRTVCSLPPVINGYHSRIQQTTRNVFIECTATDLTKANIVLDTVVAMFSQLCADPFTAEPVNVVYEATGETATTPLLSSRTLEVAMADIRGILGVDMAPEEACRLCAKMQLGPATVTQGGAAIAVTAPPTRSDVLHAVDVVEDVAIAHGYNALPLRAPRAHTVGAPQPLAAVCDLLRGEVARAGYAELLTHGLCDRRDLVAVARCEGGEEGPQAAALLSQAVALGDADYEVVRTTLLPGVLKTLQHNRSLSVKDGLRLFEISDVVLQDPATDTGARNVRRLCALYTGNTAGFEIVHGLVDRVMQLLQVVPAASYAGTSVSKAAGGAIEGGPWREGLEYFVRAVDNRTFFPGRCADVVLRRSGGSSGGGAEEVRLGSFGVLHPEVLHAYEVGEYPASVLEMDLEPLM